MSAMLVLMGFSLLGAFLVFNGGEDDEDTSDPQETDSETDTGPETETRTDIGATVTEDGAGNVSIELGEDETGSLVSMIFLDTQDSEDNFYAEFEARIYLAPEGTEFPQNTSETIQNLPGYAEFIADGGTGPYNLEAMEETLGLQLLHTIDLLPQLPEGSTSYPELIDLGLEALEQVTTDMPIDAYFLEALTDGDDLYAFLPDDFVETRNGVEKVAVTANVITGDGNNWIVVEDGAPSGLVIDTRGGEDSITTEVDGTDIRAGDGNDTVISYGDDITVSGGAGDDEINANGNNLSISGGLGADDISVVGSGQVSGGEGDDTIRAANDSTFSSWSDGFNYFETTLETGLPLDVFGGEGNDRIDVRGANTTGHGGAGNDTLRAESGAMAFGDDGDDDLVNHFAHDNATLHGGAGDDQILVQNPGSVAYGDGGNDEFNILIGASGFGGEGDDRLSLGNGTGFADGGAGNDTLSVSALATPETVTLSGGAGADVFELSPYDVVSDGTASGMTITDFNPAEDIIQIWASESGTITDVTIESGGADTPTRVTVTAIVSGHDFDFIRTSKLVTLTFLLEGGPVVTPDHIVLV